MIRSFLLLTFALLAGCAPSLSPPFADAGADALPLPATRRLAFAEGESVRLEPDQLLPLVLTLHDQHGVPVAHEEIRLGLINNARDASLGELRLFTDGSGTARTTLRASSTAATFQVRASAPAAAQSFLLVSVSSRGFGGLVVATRYEGVRGPARLEVDLFEGTACGSVDEVDPVRALRLPLPGAEVTFGGLGAGQSFAVRGRALGPTGEVLARSCLDELVIVRDQNERAALAVTDLPLRLSEGYTADLAFDLGEMAAEAGRAWAAAVEAEVAAEGGEAEYVLAAIADAVEAHGGVPARTEFERAVGDRLLTELLARGPGAVAALGRLAEDTATVSRGVRAELGLAAGGGVLEPRMLSLVVDPLTPDVQRDDLRWSVALGAAAGTATVHANDRLALDFHGVPLPFGAIARHAADALLARLGVASAAEWARLTLRCREVAGLVEGTTASCDEACVIDACEAAADRLAQGFDLALETAGSARRTVAFRVEGMAQGSAGTLRVTRMEGGTIAGAYEDASGAAVSGVARVRSP